MQEKLFQIIFEQDDVTWQTMLLELVKQEGMDPWDIDVSLLTRRYIGMLKQLKEVNFRVSGKVVLAAAILLKIKSTRLVREEIGELDRLISSQNEEEGTAEEFYDDLEQAHEERNQVIPELIPRTPLPRKRKISIYDLVGALNKALEVKGRRFLRNPASIRINIHEKKVDIIKLIEDVYEIVKAVSAAEGKITFSHITEGKSKLEKIYTFIPLLHLSNHDSRKISLIQNEPFGEIEILMRAEAEHVTIQSRKDEIAENSVVVGHI